MKNHGSVVSITYKDVFDDYESININDLISSIPTSIALEVICHFFGQMHTQERSQEFQIESIKEWTSKMTKKVQSRINDFILKNSKGRSEFNFINNFAALRLIETILENYNELAPVKTLTSEQELNFFKAYLICTQEWIDTQSSSYIDKDLKIETADDFAKYIIPIQAPQVELIEFKDFRMQFIKAIYFFKFCEKDKLFSNYLGFFLDENNIKNWQEYLKHLISTYVRKLEPPNIPTLLSLSEEHLELKKWITYFCVDPKNYKKSDDFLGLRDKPVFKYSENKFLFLNLNFFIDKLYDGIQFDFAKSLIKSKATYKSKIIKNFPDFKQIYGELYSERGLFYEVMAYVFVNQKKYIKIKGEDLSTKITDGEPDYYMRDKSKVYLFEYKDILLNARIKHSYDYQKIKDEIFKKLVKNEKGKPKGVSQLVNCIEKIVNGEFNKIDDYDFSKAIIYPIIVYTDHIFNMPGINYILEKEFKKQIENRGLGDKLTIKKIVLIDLNSLIKFQDLFREKKLTINHTLNGFYDYIESKNIFKQVTTYNQHIHNRTMRMEYSSPKMLKEEAIKLLEK